VYRQTGINLPPPPLNERGGRFIQSRSRSRRRRRKVYSKLTQ